MTSRALNEYQFRITRGTAHLAGKRTGDAVIASHPEHGIVGYMSYGMRERPASKSEGKSVNLVFVHPEHRGTAFRRGGPRAGRGGVAEGMFRLASHDVGYTLGHDEALSPAGLKFAQRVGGYMPTQRANMEQWDLANPGQLAEKQSANWMGAERIDPTLGRAAMPYNPPRKWRDPAVQPELPGMPPAPAAPHRFARKT